MKKMMILASILFSCSSVFASEGACKSQAVKVAQNLYTVENVFYDGASYQVYVGDVQKGEDSETYQVSIVDTERTEEGEVETESASIYKVEFENYGSDSACFLTSVRVVRAG